MEGYSKDLRIRAINDLESGMCRYKVAEKYTLSESTLRNWLKLKAETNSLNERPHTGGRMRKISNEELVEYMNNNQDATTQEIADNFTVSKSCAHVSLTRAKYRYKKKPYLIKNK